MAFSLFNLKNGLITTIFEVATIFSVVIYGGVAAPLFVYSYKYGSSFDTRSARLLGGIAVMFVCSSIPLMGTMLVVILGDTVEVSSYSLFLGSFALHALECSVSLFVSWFGYMAMCASAFHRWRGPERQISTVEAGQLERPNVKLAFSNGEYPAVI